ncbi:MAG: 4-aminobutyrate--2-oxoglutarate transaminase [Pseudomonadota bacterium]
MREASRSEYLRKMRSVVAPRGTANLTSFFAARAEGALIHDVDGRELIDFTGGMAALNVGHSHPKVVAALKDQAEKFTHTCWHAVMYEPYVELADRLCSLTPGSFHKMALFLNSGAEAVENAVKLARHHTGRPGLIAFEHACHGRTYIAMSLSSGGRTGKRGFGPLADQVHRLPYGYCYRCVFGLKRPECGLFCAEFPWRRLGGGGLEPELIAALIVEPVLGEGGVVVPPPGFLNRLREFCREYGIVFIADEIQTGAGWTGKMFAVEHFDLAPDLICLAQGFAAGMPLSAVTGKKEIMDSPEPGGLGGTHSGNPLGCRAALAVLDIIYHENILTRAEALGNRLRARFTDWMSRYEIIGDVRGLGAMNALELVRDRETKAPATEEAGELARFCHDRGLIISTCGAFGNVIRVLAPLVIGDDELERGLTVMEEGLAALRAGPSVRAATARAD